MAKKSAKKKISKKEKSKKLHPLVFEVIGIVIIGLAIIAHFELGIVGRLLTSFSMFIFGNWHIALPVLLIVYALMMMVQRAKPNLTGRIIIGLISLLFSITLFSHLLLVKDLMDANALLSNSVMKETWQLLITENGISNRTNYLGGGMLGAILFASFHLLFASTGTYVAAWILLIVGMILLTGKALVPYVVQLLPLAKNSVIKWMDTKKKSAMSNKKVLRERNIKEEKDHLVPIEPVATIEESITIKQHEPVIVAFTERQEIEAVVEETTDDVQFVTNEMEDESVSAYNLPSSNLLQLPAFHDQSGELDRIQINAKKLEQTLQSFGVKAKVTQVHLGPAVTKYEVLPDTGVKVSKVVSLSDDLALALAARDIRMEAPIPGKSAIGIEVPNSEIAVVSLREVLEAKENNRPDAKLMVGIGRDTTGQSILTELNKMPHLLVAGSTGSGKSVCINGIIVSILMRAKPHEVKMMMIDPKMVELTVYNGIPHLLAPVVTDARKASQALKKVVSEMERRYDLFSHTGTRNMEGYNEHVRKHNEETGEKQPELPYIVVIVDELADLMMVAANDVEDAIMRLAQMARAAGIHLIIATQRPSVDVITGVIKANIPSRIAFAVSSSVDSRTILDMGGAEKLLGRGDMLFHPAGASKPVRVQGAFLSDKEVEDVVDFVISQQKAMYQEEMIPDEIVEEGISHEQLDELYDDAVQLVTEMQTASVSLLQRRFRIGYSRAARLIDQLEMTGIVGPYEGSKPRQVLINAMLDD